MTADEWNRRFESYDAAMANHEHPTLESLVTEPYTISTWAEFHAWSAPLEARGFCFRGHEREEYQLRSLFDRTVWRQYRMTVKGYKQSGFGPLMPRENLKAMIAHYRQGDHYHHPTSATAPNSECFCHMQHYGGPTRLMDWTTSPAVALFFAVKKRGKRDAALWAVDWKCLEERSLLGLSRHDPQWTTDMHSRLQEVLLNGGPEGLMCWVNDDGSTNIRMKEQKGKLLLSVHPELFLASVLPGLLYHPSRIDRQIISKVVVKRQYRHRLLKRLLEMGVHKKALFPEDDCSSCQSTKSFLNELLAQQAKAQRFELRRMMEETLRRRFRYR